MAAPGRRLMWRLPGYGDFLAIRDPDAKLSPADLAGTPAQRRWDALVAIFLAATNRAAGTSAEPSRQITTI